MRTICMIANDQISEQCQTTYVLVHGAWHGSWCWKRVRKSLGAGLGAAVQIMVKGALNAVTRALAMEYAKEGIRVNTIAPGVINTPMHKPETHAFLKGLHPVGRIGEVKEVVDAALFLTDATFTSGEVLHVDGRRAPG
jgi:NAD(P)-dependent dehydrogenase (short-subunit alcohol dehydrogenase family)